VSRQREWGCWPGLRLVGGIQDGGLVNLAPPPHPHPAQGVNGILRDAAGIQKDQPEEDRRSEGKPLGHTHTRGNERRQKMQDKSTRDSTQGASASA